jgi:hypothetical protein
MVALPDAADDAAVSVTVCAVPGIRVKVAGLGVTPEGRPATVTLTVPVKPFCGAAFTLIVWPAPPAVRVTVAGVDVSEKSAVRTGPMVEWDPPPQDSRVNSEDRHTVQTSFGRLMTFARIARVCCECEYCFCKKRPPAVKKYEFIQHLDAGFRKRAARRQFCPKFQCVAASGQMALENLTLRVGIYNGGQGDAGP